MNKSTKKYQLGQYMTPLEIGQMMTNLFSVPVYDWHVFDPSCGDGNLLLAAIGYMKAQGVKGIHNRILGFDIDPEMIEVSKDKISKELGVRRDQVNIFLVDTEDVLSQGLFSTDFNPLLNNINVVIANPPYGKNREYLFFELCDSYFKKQAEMVFLLPIAFVDRVKNIDYIVLDGKPLGVTTGHVIVKHAAGNTFHVSKVHGAKVNGSEFEVLTGVKLYAVGEGKPPQTKEIRDLKPYSSEKPQEGWVPCLRTGDIKPYKINKDRLWIDYGDHLAHPKDKKRFLGPKLFVRRVPVWKTRSLGAAYDEEETFCAGDVLVVRHNGDSKELLKGLCVFLNSSDVAEIIFENRPSFLYRDSYPKISAKDLNKLFSENIPSNKKLIEFSKAYQGE